MRRTSIRRSDEPWIALTRRASRCGAVEGELIRLGKERICEAGPASGTFYRGAAASTFEAGIRSTFSLSTSGGQSRPRSSGQDPSPSTEPHRGGSPPVTRLRTCADESGGDRREGIRDDDTAST